MEYPLTPELLVEDVRDALLDAIALTAHRPFTVALSGGSTPKRLYRELAMSPLIEWPQVELFFGDERAVPPDHKDSNYAMVKDALLEYPRVKVTAHRMPADTGDADGYERLLKARLGAPPVFDLVLLGVGPDGHTASLFPGSPELDEQQRAVVMTAGEHLGHRRMTLTLPVINAAKRVWILAAGADKADIVARVKDQPGDLPIQRVRPRGELRWWLDKAAAAKLPH